MIIIIICKLLYLQVIILNSNNLKKKKDEIGKGKENMKIKIEIKKQVRDGRELYVSTEPLRYEQGMTQGQFFSRVL